MNWKTWVGSALIGTGLLAVETAWAVNLVVVETKGAGLNAGQVIDSQAPLTLAEGENVTLIADTGRIIHLKGPHQGAPLAGGGETVGSVKEAMASLLNSGAKESGALGATRSADEAFKMARDGKKLPDPWLVDVTQNGNHCYREGERLIFWRPDSTADSNIRVTVGKDTWRARTDWPKGKSNLLLPADVALQDGVGITMEMNGRKTESVLHVVPKTVASDPARVAWMHEKGCKDQFMALLSRIDK
ncbi:MAG: hypothetical protein HQL84_03350 [Magnetococcales bacterium]|nr:hypothetical protein [Magnetococcales bacterium]MBF0149062.1 hypothetical protein [Magnetococcales bacterium]MBF0173899.1 hypothetical protein [Magnetococcales bacterium]MBF0347125.1 hypothetical protein [Magnetococcales bacterium]MBF0630196.1 hypothetical protein [Magnetococcales bacterium]